MNIDGEAYLLARVLIAIFGKERLSCAYAVFVGIIVLVLAVIFARAESTDDLVFPIIALLFILGYVLVDGYRAIRRRSVSDFQATETGIPSEEALSIESEEAVELEPSPVSVPHKARSYLGTYIAGGLLAAGLTYPVMCLGSLAIPLRPAGSHEVVEGAAYVFAFTCLALSPIVALIGAIATWISVRLARRHSPDANLTRPLLVTGALVGVITGLIGTAIEYYLLCIGAKLCGF